MKANILFILATIPFLWQCGGNHSDSKIEENTKQQSTHVTDSSCLLQYQNDYCKLVSEDFISKEVSVTREILTKEENFYPGENGKMISCQYEWPSDRMKTVTFMGQSREFPDENYIAIGQMDVIEQKDLERYNKKSVAHYFEEFHKTASEEDEEKMKEDFEKRIDKIDMDQKEASKKIGKSILSKASEIQYIQVKDLGDNAYYSGSPMSGTQEIHLDVLKGNVTFKISVNASADQQENVKHAIQIAKEILSLCN